MAAEGEGGPRALEPILPAPPTGVFSANTIVSVFGDEWVPCGTRVLGTPPPAEALATA